MLKQGSDQLEIDYACYAKERKADFEEPVTMLAECKTNNPFFPEDVKRMETPETAFPGSVLVFSTIATELTEDEKVVIRTLIIKQRTLAEQKKPHNRILILTDHELRCYCSPPQSWSDEVKARDPNH